MHFCGQCEKYVFSCESTGVQTGLTILETFEVKLKEDTFSLLVLFKKFSNAMAVLGF